MISQKNTKIKKGEIKMLEFDNKKDWYEKNKRFLREFEKTREFKDYRNTRIKLKKIETRLEYLKNIKIEIQLLEKEKIDLFHNLEEKFLIMRTKKTREEEKYFNLEQKPTKCFKFPKKQTKLNSKEGKHKV